MASLPGAAWFRHQAGEIKGEGPGWRWQGEQGLDSTFRMVTGSRALAENLALDRELLLAEGGEGEAVALAELKGVTVRAIDWTEKLKEGEVAVDPLSLLVPEDQHALFAPSLPALFELIGLVEKEGAPILQSFDARNPYRGLPSRYRAQMGLDVPDALARLLPVDGVAVTGGDPFFPSGTDVAVILATRTPDALFDALAAAIRMKAETHDAMTPEGAAYQGYQTGDRSFSAWLARFDGAVVVANSPVQLRRIEAVVKGDAPALGVQDEFRFFRQRYPIDAEESAYLFLSDATIRRWAGPRVRIAASRRTRAAAALGELTARVIDGGEAGGDFAGLLGGIEAAGPVVCSEIYNTFGFLTPVSELELDRATPAEAAAYERWREGYEKGWSQVFDPIAIRLRLKKESRELDLSIMPLTVDSDYRRWIEVTGDTPPEKGAVAAHPEAVAFFSFAVNPESGYFRSFGEWSFEMIPELKANPLGWVGDSVSIYLDDGFFWKALQTGDAGKLIRTNFLRMPLGIRVSSRSGARLAVFLAGLRASIEKSAPDLLEWQQRKHGGQTYLAVLSKGEDTPEMRGGVFYAAMKDALLISLDEKVLQRAIDRAGEIRHTGNHVHAAARPVFLGGLGGLSGVSLPERQRMESWAAISILNEWRRLAPDRSPAAFHAEHFLESIECPGGQGYRWSGEAATMESVVFGHPTDPRGEGIVPGASGRFTQLRAGLDFEDGGLRLSAAMSGGGAPPPSAEPEPEAEVPEGFPQPGDLVRPEVGTVWRYRVSESSEDGPYTKEVKVLEAGDRDGGTLVRSHVTTKVPGEEEPYIHEEEHLLDLGYRLISSKDDERRLTFSVPMPLLPARLAPGLAFGGEYRSEAVSDEWGLEKEIGENRAKIVGLEDVTVPAGVFKDCVRIDSEYDYLTHGVIGRATDSTWYAPGVGIVKMTWKDDHDTGMEELESYERP